MLFYIDIVASCNLKCRGCPSTVFGKRSPERMSLDLFERILGKIVRDYDAGYVGFYNWTEPLLHPGLGDFIRLTKKAKQNITTSVSSNLSLRNLQPLLRAIDQGLDQLIVSVSGFSQAVHTRYHVLSDVELVKENLRMVREYVTVNGHHTHIDVHFLQFLDNKPDEELMRAFCKSVGANFCPTQAHYAKGVDNEDILRRLNYRVDPEKRGKLIDLDATSPYYDGKNRAPCEQVFDVITMNHRGEVFLCCSRYYLDDYNVGQFLDLTPEELLYSKVIHPECYYCKGQRRPATPADFHRLQKSLYFAARKDSARLAKLLNGSVYQFPEYKGIRCA